MENTLIEQLARSIFRFKKVGMTLRPELDVSMGEIIVMNGIVANSSKKNKNVSVSDIHSNEFITKPAVSQILGSLEKRGYITRTIDIVDRRKILVAITPKGTEFVKSMKEYYNNLLNDVITRFGEDNTRQLIELFNQFADISEDIKNELQEKKINN